MMRAMNRATAIVLSKNPVTLTFPGIDVLGCVQSFNTAEGLHSARLNALDRVTTEFCFYLDDDDKLPDDYLSVLDDCMAANVPIAYTNELEVTPDGFHVRVSGPYNQAEHVSKPMLIHHLVVMNTKAAVKAAAQIPRGCFNEMLLFFQLAKGGAKHIDRIGYIWNRNDGFHNTFECLLSQVRSASWCARNLS